MKFAFLKILKALIIICKSSKSLEQKSMNECNKDGNYMSDGNTLTL